MSRQHRHLVPALVSCTLLAVAGTARAATTISLDVPPTAAEMAAARRALPHRDFVDAEAYHHPLTFTVGHADLNGDGRPDLIIHYTNAEGQCARDGCPTFALLDGPNGYSSHPISLALFFGKTMTILDTVHHGMHDLRFGNSTSVFRWDGTYYDPAALFR